MIRFQKHALVARSLALLLSVSSAAIWLPPLGDSLQVIKHYDLTHGPYAAGHRGIDLPAAETQRVFAPVAGVVTFSGTVVDRPLLSIRVDSETLLSLEPVLSELKPGDPVARGQPLGTVAMGGHCASECLHLGVRVNERYVNPLRFFRGRPVLVPW